LRGLVEVQRRAHRGASPVSRTSTKLNHYKGSQCPYALSLAAAPDGVRALLLITAGLAMSHRAGWGQLQVGGSDG